MCNSWLFSAVYIACLISLHYITCIAVVLFVFMYMWQKMYWQFAAMFCWAAGSSVDVQWQTKVTSVLLVCREFSWCTVANKSDQCFVGLQGVQLMYSGKQKWLLFCFFSCTFVREVLIHWGSVTDNSACYSQMSFCFASLTPFS